MDTLDIGKVITSILMNDTTMQGYIGNRIFPIIAEVDTKFPFVIYQRNSLTTQLTKDGLYEGTAVIEIAIASDKYQPSMEIAKRVKSVLTSIRGAHNGFNIEQVELSDASEQYVDYSFVQDLTFNIYIDDEN
jgi:hypothetical protein